MKPAGSGVAGEKLLISDCQLFKTGKINFAEVGFRYAIKCLSMCFWPYSNSTSGFDLV
jgi:hypothetical protein